MSISIKGIVVGIVFAFVASLAVGFVAGIVAVFLLGPDAMESLVGSTPGQMTAPIFFISVLVSVASGYVAARVAGGGELINAALSNLVGSGLALLMAMSMNRIHS